MRRAFDGGTLQLEINAALIAVRGIGAEAQSPRLAGNGGRREEGGFEEQVGGGIADARMLTAHDAGQRQRLGVVGDKSGVARRFDALFVEQQQLLARLRATDMNGARQFGVVEGMQRLTEFQHHVVGDIDQGGNRADAAALDALPDPVRRRCLGIDAANDTATVTRTYIRGIEDDGARVSERRGHGFDDR